MEKDFKYWVYKSILWVVRFIMLLALTILCIGLLYYFNGSLEKFPTEEDHFKAKLVAIIIITVSVFAEFILYLIHKFITRKTRS